MVRIDSEMLSHGPWLVRVCICTCTRGSVYTGNQLGNQKKILVKSDADAQKNINEFRPLC